MVPAPVLLRALTLAADPAVALVVAPQLGTNTKVARQLEGTRASRLAGDRSSYESIVSSTPEPRKKLEAARFHQC
jgi:hypothetical protein